MAGKVNLEKYLDIVGALVLVVDRSEEIVYVNQKFSEVFEYSKKEILGKNMFDEYVQEHQKDTLKDIFDKIIRGEIESIEHLEVPLTTRLGQERVIVWNFVPMRNDEGEIVGIIGSGDNITERKKMEDALKRSEHKYRELVQNVNSVILRLDITGKIIFMNNFGLKFFGYTEEELVGKNIVGTLVPEVDTAGRNLSKLVQEISAHPEQYVINENENMCRDGSRVWVSWTNSAIADRYGHVLEILGVGSDITERKEASDTLRRVNRHLMALIECNQAMVHAQNLFDLLQEVCRIIVETAGYKMAWVGLAEHDEEKTVRPVAYAGFEENFLKSIKVSWEDNEFGRGPSGAAIRTGKPFMSANILIDPRFTLWRDEAVKRGYHSTISIPLVCEPGEDAFGALNIYAPVPDAFDTEDIKLLMELGRDLAYGILMLRMRMKVQENEKFLSEVFSSVQDGISVLDRDLNILRVNSVMEKWYAHAMPIIGKKCYEVYHGRKEPCTVCPTLRTIASGKSDYEVVPKTGPGGVIQGWQDLYSFPLIDSITGEITGVIEYVRDITERRKSEELLQRTSKEISIALDTANMGVWQADLLTGTVTTLHGGGPISGLVGYPKTEAEFLALVHPEDRSAVADGIKSAREDKGEYRIEFRIIRPDGEIRWVYANGKVVHDSSGKAVSLIGADLDITERKKVEEEIAIFQKFAQNAGQGFGMATLDGKITYTNQALCRIFEEDKPEDVLKKNILEYYPQEWHHNLNNVVLPIVLSKGQWIGESVLLSKKGNRTSVIENIFLISDNNGKPQYFANVITDISERKRLEEWLKGAEQYFSAIFDNTSDGILLVDVETKRFHIGNKTICLMLGYTAEEVKSLGVSDIHPPESLRQTLEQFEKLARKEIDVARAVPVKRKDGGILYADISTMFATLGSKTYLMGIFREVKKTG